MPVTGARVDLRAQGPFSASRAEKIATNLDPDLLGYPFVWKDAQGNYWIIDGQHRFRAVAMALGQDQKIQCEVVSGITLERAAALYRGRNTMRAARFIDKFMSGITARDPVCAAINDIVHSFGLKITRTTNEGGMVCAQALTKIYGLDANRGNILRMTLKVVTDAWGKDPQALPGDVLVGLGLMLQRNPSVDLTALAEKLTAHPGGSLGLLGRGRTLRTAYKGAIATSVARAVIMAFNSGRRSNLLPDWDKRTQQQVSASIKTPGTPRKKANPIANGAATETVQ